MSAAGVSQVPLVSVVSQAAISHNYLWCFRYPLWYIQASLVSAVSLHGVSQTPETPKTPEALETPETP